MAQELVIRGGIYFNDGLGDPQLLEVLGTFLDITTKLFSKFTKGILITTTALPLGGVTSPGPFIIINRDPLNYVELQLSSGGSKFAVLQPGVPCIGCFPSTVTAPYAISTGGTCTVEGLIVSN